MPQLKRKRCWLPRPTESWGHVRVVDKENRDVGPGAVGEIIAQSDSIMTEYWKKPKETAEAIVEGWLHTGDLAYYDEKGFL